MAEANPKDDPPSDGEDGDEKEETSSGKSSGESSPWKSPQSTTEWLMSLMKQSLTLEEKPEQLLPVVSFDGVVEYIKSAKCKNIVTMAGAGISTSAGIPDFRSPGSGLYNNLEKYNLPSPQAIFEIDFFRENPEPFFHLARELWPGLFKPTPGHYFLKLLDDHGLLKRHYTQNIDTLERVAGLDGEKLVEAHGTFHTGHCITCHAVYTQEWLKEQIFSDKGVPKCEEEDCQGFVKPDIVFFGEALPPRFFNCVSEDLPGCDLLIIMGTSLVVQPFASLTQRVPDTCPRLYINLEKSQDSGDPLMALLGMSSGFRFDADDNYRFDFTVKPVVKATYIKRSNSILKLVAAQNRDIFWQGTCDDGCMELADRLGWGDELRGLVEKEHERITKEFEAEQTANEESPKTSATPKSEL